MKKFFLALTLSLSMLTSTSFAAEFFGRIVGMGLTSTTSTFEGGYVMLRYAVTGDELLVLYISDPDNFNYILQSHNFNKERQTTNLLPEVYTWQYQDGIYIKHNY